MTTLHSMHLWLASRRRSPAASNWIHRKSLKHSRSKKEKEKKKKEIVQVIGSLNVGKEHNAYSRDKEHLSGWNSNRKILILVSHYHVGCYSCKFKASYLPWTGHLSYSDIPTAVKKSSVPPLDIVAGGTGINTEPMRLVPIVRLLCDVYGFFL